jgi:NTP pyrophosphatase (non-canonical NTP hydrolase)
MRKLKLPNPAERERLTLLAEECAEVIQAVTKILRHGYSSHHPNGGADNRQNLEGELGDLRFATILMCEAKDIKKDEIHTNAHDKGERVRQYLHHQPQELLDRATEAAL